MDAVSQVLLTFIEFDTPSTKHVDFDAVIGGSISYEARELLRVATQHRETLLDGLDNSGKKVDPRNVVGSVENYLPHVYKITRSMEYSAKAQIKLNKKLEFAWTSVLLRRKKEFKFGVLVFELCFILTIQSLAHYNTAKLLLDPEQKGGASNLVAAAKEIRKGAGILEFAHQVLIPRWVSPPENRPPEVVSQVVGALAQMFLCMGQRISVVQAIQKQSAPSVIAKLLFGLSERYNTVNGMLRKLDRTMYETLFEQVSDEPPLMAAICYSLGLKYLGESSEGKAKPGEAVAFLRFASDNLSKITFTPPMADLYREKVISMRHVVDEQFLEYKATNESVYFEGVPTRDQLEIPNGSFIINPLDFSMPEVEPLSFASVGGTAEVESQPSKPEEKRKSLSSWFGMGSKKSEQQEESDALEAPPGYDKEVFDGLPDDIKKEVIAGYKAQAK